MPPSNRSKSTKASTRSVRSVSSGEIAILSDIHSNLHALDAVFAECERRKITRFCCLGDIVGYGTYPAECLTLVRSLKCPTVMGNHDFYVATGEWSEYLSDLAQAGVEYSIRKLTSSARKWLGNLPDVHSADNFTLVHASLQAPLDWDYILTNDQAGPTLELQTTPLCFYGHTHKPKLFVGRGGQPERVTQNMFRFHREGRYLINPGSVGQPRGDGDARAQFAIFSPCALTVEFVRVDYDVRGAAEAISNAGLPSYLADRLIAGM